MSRSGSSGLKLKPSHGGGSAGFRGFSAAVLSRAVVILCLAESLRSRCGDDPARRRGTQTLTGCILPSSCSRPHKPVDRTFRGLELAFLREERGDIPARETLTSQRLHEFAIRLQARTALFRGCTPQDVMKLIFHGIRPRGLCCAR
jgi:hypothetical protein